jgi:NADPH2:quinone reductase
MKAWHYDKTGPAADVLTCSELPTPQPGPGEVRVRLAWSGVNPSDVKSRGGTRPMPFARVIPHSDGSGTIDAVGPGVEARRLAARPARRPSTAACPRPRPCRCRKPPRARPAPAWASRA